MLDDRKHGSQISINSIPIASFLKLTPSTAHNDKPLPHRFPLFVFRLYTRDRAGNDVSPHSDISFAL
jgi:hypothetical protein